MSYILDALRRADAERRQGQAPDLRQVTALAADIPAAGGTAGIGRWGRTLALGVALLIAAGLGGWWFGRVAAPPPASAPVAAVVPATVSTASAAMATPTAATAPAPAHPGPAAGPPARAAAPPAPAPARVPAPPAVAAKPRAAPASQAAEPARPLAAHALPEPRRSAVAALPLGGAVHSQDRRQSFVLLGGQIVHEGATLGPGIVLERILPRALWLRVDDQLVERPL